MQGRLLSFVALQHMLEISRKMADVNRKQASTHCFFVVFSWCQTCMYSRLVVLCLLMYPWPFPRCQGAHFPPYSTFIPYRDQPALANVTLERRSIFIQLFNSWWYLCARKSPHALHLVSQKFSQRCPWNSSNVHQTDDGPHSSFQGRSSPSASFFHAFLVQAICGVMSLALCPQVVFQATQYFRFSETQATCEGCFARLSIRGVVSLHSGMPRAVYPQEFWKLMLTIDWHIQVRASQSTFHFL